MFGNFGPSIKVKYFFRNTQSFLFPAGHLEREDKIVMIRFGHDWDPTCMKMDETLFAIAEVENFATIYLVDITKVPGKLIIL